MTAQDIRDRLRGAGTKQVAEAEKAAAIANAANMKASARDRQMARWFDSQFGSRKAMRIFEADVVDADVESRSGIRQDGSEYYQEIGVFSLANVKVEEGQPANTIEFRLPDPESTSARRDSKGNLTFSQHSEAAIMIRESGGALDDLPDLIGRRWRFVGDWMPTFQQRGSQFWEGTYFYRVAPLSDATAPSREPLSENLEKLAAFCIGKTEEELKGTNSTVSAALLRAMGSLGIKDSPLQALVASGKFLETASGQGLIALDEADRFIDPTAPDDKPFEETAGTPGTQ